ncbi:DUF6768 family protein [Sungkyunkwania multivorans]|uniref:DUF6768 family protein n=1 Tax=Sungkyunkwania multivorans TaxID=1173618 RepID=A0ABW3CWH3_9FLAO
MKSELEDIDKLIKEALTEEEAAFYDELEEENLINKVIGVHRGKIGWLVIIMTIVHVVVFGLFIYCLVQFLNAETTEELIKWSAAGFLSLLPTAMIKLFSWMQMDKRDILRELKRLELQVAALASREKK